MRNPRRIRSEPARYSRPCRSSTPTNVWTPTELTPRHHRNAKLTHLPSEDVRREKFGRKLMNAANATEDMSFHANFVASVIDGRSRSSTTGSSK
jgi:hypothetical protein